MPLTPLQPPTALLFMIRIGLAGWVAVALPESHMRWGQDPGSAGVEGQHAFAILFVFAGIGILCGLAFFAVTSLLHLCLRRRLWIVLGFDVTLAIALLISLVYSGINAKYSVQP